MNYSGFEKIDFKCRNYKVLLCIQININIDISNTDVLFNKVGDAVSLPQAIYLPL